VKIKVQIDLPPKPDAAIVAALRKLGTALKAEVIERSEAPHGAYSMTIHTIADPEPAAGAPAAAAAPAKRTRRAGP
jgi:hypothetical protein